MTQLLGDGGQLVDEVLDVLKGLLRPQRPRLMAIAVTYSTWDGAVLGP
jgi:hypothetical protein